MNSYSRNVQWLVWTFLILVILAIGGAFVITRLKKIQSAVRALPVYSQVREFALTNQLNAPYSLRRLTNQVWVADIIFTRCAGPCPILTQHLSVLLAALPKEAPVKLVSLTADPEFDTPAILKTYAGRFKADPARWCFLTGQKKEIYRLAENDLKLAVAEPNPAAPVADRFIHSTRFVLVDQRGQVRGFFDGETAASTRQILQDIKALLAENGK